MTPEAATADPLLLMIVAGGGALFVALMLGFAFAGDGSSGRIKRRMTEVGLDPAARNKAVTERMSARKVEQHSSIRILDMILRRLLPHPAVLRKRLEKTGRKISISEYILATVLTISVFFAWFYFFLGYPVIISLPSGFGLGLMLPHWIVGFLGKRRVNKFLKQFPEAIDLMVRTIRSGLPIGEAINSAAHDSPDPVGKEFRAVADAVRLGKSLEDALWEVSRRVDAQEFKFLITSISIQRETGGNLAETLHGLANTLRRRRQVKLKIRALSSEARASAWIIGSLPFIMFVLMWFANSEYIGMLINDPRGIILCGIGLTLIAMGVGIMAKMVRFEI